MAQLNFTIVCTLQTQVHVDPNIPGQDLVQAKALDPCSGKSGSWGTSFLQNPHSPHSLCNSRKSVYQKPSPKVWNKSKRDICHHRKTRISLWSLRTGLSELWSCGKLCLKRCFFQLELSWLSWGKHSGIIELPVVCLHVSPSFCISSPEDGLRVIAKKSALL